MPTTLFSANKKLQEALDLRISKDALRSLKQSDHLIDFCSNDYLGFARNIELKKSIDNFCQNDHRINGSTGSRLLAGNSKLAEDVEQYIAKFHQAEAGLLYNSGYDANVGLFSALGKKGDTIIYDEYIHASVHDGIRLCKAENYFFKHNDLLHLEERLLSAKGIVYVAVESIYSMDGDSCPLREVADLCEKYGANLIVDEAHATGIFGRNGEGFVVQENLSDRVFARIHTFGKALGCHGAIVLGNNILRNYLINFSRSFIYTTALPTHALSSIFMSYQFLENKGNDILFLKDLIDFFKQNVNEISQFFIESKSPIQSLILSGNSNVKKLAQTIQKTGFDVRPILNPTVPRGKERLRICIHSFNTKEEILKLAEILVSEMKFKA